MAHAGNPRAGKPVTPLHLDRAWAALLLLVFSAQGQSPIPKGTWRIADAPAELRPAISRADLVVVSMHEALRRELSDALVRGPVSAITACHIDVVGITQRITRGQGLAAGRTSHRLRNQANAPSPWAAPLVRATAGRMARDVDGFVVDLGSSVGVLRPIAQQTMCRACHGPANEIDPAVRAELAKRYPADEAVGFAEGEIRGWFWVEVPKAQR